MFQSTLVSQTPVKYCICCIWTYSSVPQLPIPECIIYVICTGLMATVKLQQWLPCQAFITKLLTFDTNPFQSYSGDINRSCQVQFVLDNLNHCWTQLFPYPLHAQLLYSWIRLLLWQSVTCYKEVLITWHRKILWCIMTVCK